MMADEESTAAPPPPPPPAASPDSREERLDLYEYDSLPCNNNVAAAAAQGTSSCNLSPAPLEPRTKRVYVVDDDMDDDVDEQGVTQEVVTVAADDDHTTTPSPSVIDASFADSTITTTEDVNAFDANHHLHPEVVGSLSSSQDYQQQQQQQQNLLDEISLTGTSVSDVGDIHVSSKLPTSSSSPSASFDYSNTTSPSKSNYGSHYDTFSVQRPPSLHDLVQQDGLGSNRSTLFNILKAYEYRRKISFDKQTLSTSVYWDAVQAFLRKSVKETNVTEQVIRARILANREYARYMTAMSNCCDAMDEDTQTNPIHSTTAQSSTDDDRNFKTSAREEYVMLRSNGELLVKHRPKVIGKDNPSDNDNKATGKEPNISFNDLIMEENERQSNATASNEERTPQSSNSNLVPDAFNTSTQGDELLGYLSAMAHSHRQVATRFTKSADKMTNDTLIEIVALRKQLSYVNYRAEAVGKAVLLELRTAEQKVRDAWNAYAEIVELYERSKLIGETNPADDPMSNNCKWNDMWLHEARYRVAVSLLNLCWSKCGATLSKLFTKVKDVEVERRICLKELMIQLVQRQEVEWMGLANTGAGVLTNLASTSIEPAVIHQGLQDAIRREAKNNAKKEHERILLQERAAQNSKNKNNNSGSNDNPARMSTNNNENTISMRLSSSSIPDFSAELLSSASTADFVVDNNEKDTIMMEISSPLTSELLGAAHVLRRKRCSGVFKSWRSTLAITTVDRYLHFFDASNNNNRDASSCWRTTEMAYHELMPNVETPSEETVNISANPRKAPSRQWHKLIEPTESLFLPRCEAGIFFDESTRMHVLEIKEKKPTSGRRSFFGKKNTVKKMFIQAEHEDNLTYWAEGLEQMGVKMKK